MKIHIFKEGNKILIKIDEQEKKELSYESINYFITQRIERLSEKIEFECLDELSDYKTLVMKIDSEITKSAFIDEIEKLKKMQKASILQVNTIE